MTENGAPTRENLLTSTHRLKDLQNVPALADVTTEEALCYFNQMLDNLLFIRKTLVLDTDISRQRAFSSSSLCSVCSGNNEPTSPAPVDGSTNPFPNNEPSLATEEKGTPSSDMSQDNKSSLEPTFSSIFSPLEQNSQRRSSSVSSTGRPEALSGIKSNGMEAIFDEATVIAGVLNSGHDCACSGHSQPAFVCSSYEPYVPSPKLASRNASRTAVTKPEFDRRSAIIKRFLGRKPPSISYWDYLLRINHYCKMSTSVYLAASLYIYRMCVNLQTCALTPVSVHRLIFVALRIACKNIEDVNYKQPRFATVAGVTLMDLYRLEVAFLFLIDFDICVDSAVLQHHLVVLTELQVQADKYRQLSVLPSDSTPEVAVV